MQKKSLFAAALFIVAITFSLAVASDQTSEERGKGYFNDPGFAGGSKACSKCHPNGRGLENAGSKATFNIMGDTQNSLEEAINACIVNANKGHAIAVDSPEMLDLASYVRSFGNK